MHEKSGWGEITGARIGGQAPPPAVDSLVVVVKRPPENRPHEGTSPSPSGTRQTLMAVNGWENFDLRQWARDGGHATVGGGVGGTLPLRASRVGWVTVVPMASQADHRGAEGGVGEGGVLHLPHQPP